MQGRLSCIRFAGLALYGTVPDTETIWLYRKHGYLAMAGQIIDATLIELGRLRPARSLPPAGAATACWFARIGGLTDRTQTEPSRRRRCDMP